MFYHVDYYQSFYLLFRAMFSIFSSFFMMLYLGPIFINFSKKQFKNTDRPFAPDTHKGKGKTATMGGLLMIVVILINALLWSDRAYPQFWLFMVTLLGFGAIGLLDDLYKVWYKKGLAARQKMALQLLVSLFVGLSIFYGTSLDACVHIPFTQNWVICLGYWYIPWVMLVLIATSNAVNLTDGLDGLAISSLLPNYVLFSILGYCASNSEFSTIGTILIGTSLGFLWFNRYPAQIFMGDVGSLSLGAILGLMALLCKQELLLPISGVIFVFEALSVILQCTSIKLYKKRIFKMAPIHHHFELHGWQEPKITVRFTIVSVILCLVAFLLNTQGCLFS